MAERDKPQYRLLIRDMPAKERPRERLRDYGAAYLSNAELIAILLRTGTSSENVIDLSNRLLAKYGGLEGISKASFQELASIHGMGDAKTAQLKSALELSKRLMASSGDARPEVHSPEAVVNLLGAEMSLLEQEQFRVVALNIKNQVINISTVYKGNVNSAVVRASEVFQDAVRSNCPSVILVHNHPSGDPSPSPDDIAVTKQLVAAGELLDITVLDHIVIGQSSYGSYTSMKKNRLGFG